MEETGCEIICGVTTTLAVKGTMMMTMRQSCKVTPGRPNTVSFIKHSKIFQIRAKNKSPDDKKDYGGSQFWTQHNLNNTSFYHTTGERYSPPSGTEGKKDLPR